MDFSTESSGSSYRGYKYSTVSSLVSNLMCSETYDCNCTGRMCEGSVVCVFVKVGVPYMKVPLCVRNVFLVREWERQW